MSRGKHKRSSATEAERLGSGVYVSRRTMSSSATQSHTPSRYLSRRVWRTSSSPRALEVCGFSGRGRSSSGTRRSWLGMTGRVGVQHELATCRRGLAAAAWPVFVLRCRPGHFGRLGVALRLGHDRPQCASTGRRLALRNIAVRTPSGHRQTCRCRPQLPGVVPLGHGLGQRRCLRWPPAEDRRLPTPAAAASASMVMAVPSEPVTGRAPRREWPGGQPRSGVARYAVAGRARPRPRPPPHRLCRPRPQHGPLD